MKKKILICVLFFVQMAKSQSILQYQYNINIRQNVKFDSLFTLSVPSRVEINMNIITNNRYYLIESTIQDITIANKNAPSNEQNERILIDTHDSLVYFFSTNTFSKFLYKKVYPLEYQKAYYMSRNNDTAFIQYNPELTKYTLPFPYLSESIFGISAIHSNEFDVLISELPKQIEFDFTNLLVEIKSFTFQKNKFAFAF